MSAQTVKETINRADPNTLADILRKLAFGDILRTIVTFLFGKAPAASSYQLVTLQAIALPDGAKAATIHRAYARATAAAGTLGELAPQAYGATPADAQIAVAPNGDIVVLAASAYTDIDVVYQPLKQDVIELNLPVAANILTIPTTFRALSLLEAEATVGGATGKKIILVPGAAPGVVGQANLNLAKSQVQFTPADAVTMARVKLGVTPAVDVDAVLESASIYI